MQQAPQPAQVSSQGSLLHNVKQDKSPNQTKTQAAAQQKTRYIPSPEGVKIKNEVPSAEVDIAMKQADAAEKQALEVLGGKLD